MVVPHKKRYRKHRQEQDPEQYIGHIKDAVRAAEDIIRYDPEQVVDP